MSDEWHKKIFSVTESTFEQLALEIFQYQYAENQVYKSYIDALGISLSGVNNIEKIPFLPVRFFKTDTIKTGRFNAELIFESSGTAQTSKSYHHVKDASVYEESFTRAFENSYGGLVNWCIVGLLPSYLERKNSSLVYMVDMLIRKGRHKMSGFYLYDFEKLKDTLGSLEKSKEKTLLIGVTYALLDFAEKFPFALRNTLIMETGGMKGRREELTRMEVHNIIKKAFELSEIHSEYGMTELLSQAYSKKDGRFQSPPWMKVMIRDEEDPLSVSTPGSQVKEQIAGALNIIDLANIHSCSFIATDDIGRLDPDGNFEVLGRIDGSDLRGCSLLTV